MDVGDVHEDEEILSLDADLIDAFIEKHKGAKNAAKKVEIDLVAKIRRHTDDPKFIRLGDKLEKRVSSMNRDSSIA
jgi:type I restriction enzyme R subunit